MVKRRNIKLIMAFKTVLTTATTLGLISDTSMADIDS
jgi:hypothetical protein